MSNKIRTTMRPTVEIEVSDRELLELERQGLVLKSGASTDAGAQRAAVKQVAAQQEEK